MHKEVSSKLLNLKVTKYYLVIIRDPYRHVEPHAKKLLNSSNNNCLHQKIVGFFYLFVHFESSALGGTPVNFSIICSTRGQKQINSRG